MDKFPPKSWNDRQVLDWLVHAFQNHLTSHSRLVYVLLGGLFIVLAALIGVLLK